VAIHVHEFMSLDGVIDAPVWSFEYGFDDGQGEDLGAVTWSNSRVLGTYDPDAIARLRDETDGDVFVAGSGTLVRAMLADGLVDGLHLFVYPLTRGEGPRLFPDGAPPRTLELERSRQYPNGVLYLSLRPVA
jgi:dihydrofolate reductase